MSLRPAAEVKRLSERGVTGGLSSSLVSAEAHFDNLFLVKRSFRVVGDGLRPQMFWMTSRWRTEGETMSRHDDGTLNGCEDQFVSCTGSEGLTGILMTSVFCSFF